MLNHYGDLWLLFPILNDWVQWNICDSLKTLECVACGEWDRSLIIYSSDVICLRSRRKSDLDLISFWLCEPQGLRRFPSFRSSLGLTFEIIIGLWLMANFYSHFHLSPTLFFHRKKFLVRKINLHFLRVPGERSQVKTNLKPNSSCIENGSNVSFLLDSGWPLDTGNTGYTLFVLERYFILIFLLENAGFYLTVLENILELILRWALLIFSGVMFFKKFFLIKVEVTKYVGILSALAYSQRPESTKCPPNIQ